MSRPELAALEEQIARIGEEAIFERIASGERIGKIAESLGVGRRMLYRWRDNGEHKERRQQEWSEALKLSGEGCAEMGMQVLEDLAGESEVTSGRIQLATSRSNYLKWLAGVRDRDTYGDKSGGTVNVQNLNVLHLDALRSLGTVTKPALPAPEPELMEAEVV
jgi:hypothetical protein